MTCARASAKTHWTGVGFRAAKMGLAFEQIAPSNKTASGWVREGMDKFARRVARAEKRDNRIVAEWWKGLGA